MNILGFIYTHICCKKILNKLQTCWIHSWSKIYLNQSSVSTNSQWEKLNRYVTLEMLFVLVLGEHKALG